VRTNRVAPRTVGLRTRWATEYLTGQGIAGLRPDPVNRRIVGLSGVDIGIAVAGRRAQTVTHLREADSSRTFVWIALEGGHGPQDAVVSMRLDHFAPVFAAWVDQNKHRLYKEE
jgi:hypothetical protein